MMYSEFLELSGKEEAYISFTEYTNEIEPIYMNSSCLNKREFIRAFKKTFRTIVQTAIETAYNKIPSDIKEAYVFSNDNTLERQLEVIDREARQIGYKYLELITR
ncbi:MAG: hypothetical protein LIO87_09540 [Eubacterium sp.]|nr:hypothetical protein [Eubacterium sp.]